MREDFYLILLLIGANEVLLENVNPCDFKRITDFSTTDCPPNTFYHEKGHELYNCFPTCFPDPLNDNIETERCNTDDDKLKFKPCPPGYNCKKNEEGNKFCTINEDSCFKYHANYFNNKWNEAIWKPECLPDGTWAPKQCKGESSSRRCFCFDSVGKRIFGQEFYKEDSIMNCGCSRKRLELIKSGSFYASLHCSSNGNYEQLQCNEGNCWCVEPTSGEIISEIVPETMMKFLKCHSLMTAMKVGDQYLRQCESQEYAQAKILHELGMHGTNQITFDHLLCDADGSYGAYQIKNGIVTCKWRDNSDLNSGAGVDRNTGSYCNCLRDSRIFEDAGMNHGKSCTATGSYNPIQQLNNGTFYCVDSDGYRKSPYQVEPITEPQFCENFV